MFVGVRLEGSGSDGIVITIICNHYILISALCADRKAACIISIQFVDVLDLDVYFMGR